MDVAAHLLMAIFFVIPGWWMPARSAVEVKTWARLSEDLPRAWGLLQTTLSLAAIVSLLSVAAGTIVGMATFRLWRRGRRWGELVLWTAAFTPPILYAGGFLASFGPAGWLGSAEPTASGLLGACAVHAMAAVPLVALLVGAACRRIDPILEESALLDGSAASVLFHVTLPAIRPVLPAAALVACLPLFVDVAVTDLFMVRTFAEEAYIQNEVGGDPAAAVLLGAPSAGIAALLMWAAARRAARTTFVPGRTVIFPADRSVPPILVALAVVALLYAVPVFGVAVQLGRESDPDDWRALRWSASAAARYLEQDVGGGSPAMLASASIALLTGAVTTAVALLLAWWACRGGAGRRSLALGLACWSLALPGPVIGLSWMELLNRAGPAGWVYDSPLVVVIGEVSRWLPVAFLILLAAYASLDARRWEEAILEGAGPWALFFLRGAPLAAPAAIFAFAFVTAQSIGELAVAKLLAPPGLDLASLRLFQLLHTGTGNQQAAMLVILWSMVAFAAGLAMFLAGYVRGRNR